MTAGRVTLGLASIVSILFFPFWTFFLFSAALAVRWRAWEIVFLGLIFDWLYVLPGMPFFVPFPATLTAALLLAAFEPFRRRLRNQ